MSNSSLTQEQEDAIIADHLARKAALRVAISTAVVAPSPDIVPRKEEAICRNCGSPFTALAFDCMGFTIAALNCGLCVEAHRREFNLVLNPKATDPEAAWRAICTEPEFRTRAEGGATDSARLRRDCPAYEEVTNWQYGPVGLVVRGDTGRCKTRCVWRLLRKQFDQGRSIAWTTSGRFAREYADAAGSFMLTAWFDRLARADVFFMDDLGKARWTEGAWAQFFELVDERGKHHRPIIITTNETLKTLQPKCPDIVTWEPLARRLENANRRVVF